MTNKEIKVIENRIDEAFFKLKGAMLTLDVKAIAFNFKELKEMVGILIKELKK